MSNQLAINQQLNVNDQLVSTSGTWRLVLQADGNLVLYRSDLTPFWATNTYGEPTSRAIFQSDGNFVCYDSSNHPLWASGTDGSGGTRIVMQDDGNLVIYDDSNSPKWASNTGGDKYVWHTDLRDPEGWTEVEIRRDGTARFSGHVMNRGNFSPGEDFAVRTATPGKVCLIFQRTGHLGGFLDASDRDNWWDETSNRPDVAANFDELLGGGPLAAAESKTNVFTDIFGAVTAYAVNLIEQSVIGVPQIQLLILAGGELGSLIQSGNLVPGARIIAGTLYTAGPQGALYALFGAGLAAIGANQRQITDDEYNWANNKVFSGTLPPKDSIGITDTIGANDRPFTFPAAFGGVSVNLGQRRFADPMGTDPGTFIHELTHAWQIQQSPSPRAWIADGFAAQLLNVTYDYGGSVQSFGSLNIEQQAQAVEEWYVGDDLARISGYTTHRQEGFPPEDSRNVNQGGNPYYEYILNNIRLGKP